MYFNLLQKSKKSRTYNFETNKNRDIYLKFTGYKDTSKKSANQIAKEYNISRQRVYKVVKTVQNKLLKGDMSL
jgi:predicted DNA-binding protein YlxM (UPF0122 family)